MLRKLVRDRTCRPALRWILESLLEYLTHKLAKWSTRNVNPKPGLDSVTETNARNKEPSVRRPEDSMRPSSTTIQLVDLQNLSQGKTGETSSRILRSSQRERLCSRYRGDQIEDSAPRCLTSFKLLQAKFTRSTPKPPITQQREVGSLPSNRGLAGNVNRSQDGEQETHKGKQYWARKEQGQKRAGSVKGIVARFAVVEQKEMGGNMQEQQPVKPRLIGRGLLLSSLMERFETTATVRKGGDLKSSNERRPKVNSAVKQQVALHERGQQQAADQQARKQRQLREMKSKSAKEELKEIQTAERLAQSMDITTKVKPNMRLQSQLTTKQKRDRSDQKTKGHCLLKNTRCQPDNNNVSKGWSSGESQSAVEETQRVADTLKCGRLQLLCSASVIEWSLPEPHRVFIQVETPMNWHVATILPCVAVWSLACTVSSPEQYFKKPKCGTFESSELDKIPHSLEEAPHEAVLRRSHDPAATSEPCSRVPEWDCAGQNPVENKAEEEHGPQRDATVQRRLPKYLIPRIYRCEDQPIADQTAPSAETTTPVDRMLASSSDTSPTGFNSGNKTIGSVQDVHSHLDNHKTGNANHHSVTQKKAAESKPKEKDDREDDREGRDRAVTPKSDTDVTQSLGISEVTISTATFENGNTPAVALHNQIQPQTDHQKERPKYKTINYGDPSVKRTYKPKIIRFTDTFTF